MKAVFTLMLTIALALAGASIAQAQGKLSGGRDTPVEKGGPYDRVYYPENAPAPGEGSSFPQEWLYAYGNTERNAAAFNAPDNALAWVKEGVSWKFAEARAWPLANKPYASDAIGEASGDTTMPGRRRRRQRAW